MISGYFKYMDLARLKHLGILIEIIGRVLSRKAIQRSSVLNLCLMMSDVYILIWHQEKGRKTMVSHKSVWRSRSFVLLPLLKCWYLDLMDKVQYLIYIYKLTK